MADPVLVGTITGLTKASWGTGGAGSSTLGYIYKATHRKAGEQDKVYDGNGFTIGQIFFDDTDELELEILALDAAALPARGAALTVNSVAGVVQESSLEWGHKAWKMIRVKAMKFVNMTVGA
jgi:hypothetical protein